MKAFLFLSLIFFVFSEEEDDESICEKIATKDACLNQKLDSNDDYCCMFSYQYSEEEEETFTSCTLYSKNYLGLLKDKKTMTVLREEVGFRTTRNPDAYEESEKYNSKLKIECNDDSVEVDPNSFVFSQEEKSLFESENHCLSYFEKYLDGREKANDSICQKGTLTKNAADEGFICGFYNMTFKLGEGETKNYQTCFMVNNEDIKTGRLNSFTRYYLDEMGIEALDEDNELDLNYIFEVTVGNSTASYKEGTIIDEDNEGNEVNDNKGNEGNESNKANEDNEDNEGNESNKGNESSDTKRDGNDNKSDMIKISKYLLLFLILF